MFSHSVLHAYRPRGIPYALIAPVEIIPATGCSLVATYYAVQIEGARALAAYQFHKILRVGPPSAAGVGHDLLLASCLVLGCSVSSYRHRMRGREPYQGAIFLGWIVWVGLVGLGAGCEVGTVLAAMLPWALVAAMLSSYWGHLGAKRLFWRPKVDVATLILEDGRAPSLFC
ncbi:hypothetical protein SAMD00023353_0202270 [Rosellinia necatrix]|uniref:Uncharacterized protein n=1 Tax=Rosellinia necatrix TaxID=77044 RepID=A0A1S8A591_ROSNE|nr:hypothetical protein SAMD00023353_0202270 [Rosellinia necatrix]